MIHDDVESRAGNSLMFHSARVPRPVQLMPKRATSWCPLQLAYTARHGWGGGQLDPRYGHFQWKVSGKNGRNWGYPHGCLDMSCTEGETTSPGIYAGTGSSRGKAFPEKSWKTWRVMILQRHGQCVGWSNVDLSHLTFSCAHKSLNWVCIPSQHTCVCTYTCRLNTYMRAQILRMQKQRRQRKQKKEEKERVTEWNKRWKKQKMTRWIEMLEKEVDSHQIWISSSDCPCTWLLCETSRSSSTAIALGPADSSRRNCSPTISHQAELYNQRQHCCSITIHQYQP